MPRLFQLFVCVVLTASAVACAPANAASRRGSKCKAPIPLGKKDTTLQRSLEAALKKKGWWKYVKKKALAVSIVDLTRQTRRYYAGVNDDVMMYAASMPKIAILLTVIDQVQKKKLKWTHEMDRRLQNMVTKSSNADATWAGKLVGLKQIEKTMRDKRYCFYEEPKGGLWVGRYYGHTAKSNRDPVFNISHGSTSRQAARYYTMLDAGKLVNKHWSFRMLGLMSPPKHHHKFVGGLRKVPGVVFLARKSGSWRNFHTDSALIQHDGHRYVLIGISELKKGEKLMRDLAKMVDEIISEGKHRPKRRRRKSAKKS